MIGDAFETTLAAAQTGAEWALAALYRDLNPRLLRYLRARAGQDADDVASATWVDVSRNLNGFTGGEDDFRGWLFTITRRRLSDHRRTLARRPADPVPAETLVAHDAVPDAAEAALAGRLGDAAARQIVAVLPPDQADVVLLRVVAGLSVDEVAARTGKRPGAVRVLQHRALKRLAQEIRDDL